MRSKTIKKFVAFFVTFLVVQIIIAATTSVAVFAAEIDTGISTNDAAGSISGSVWSDTNLNGIREIQEDVQKTIIVYLQVEGEDMVEGLITDANGYFAFSKLPYDNYQVWAEDMDGNATLVQEIVLSEVSGVAELSIALQPELSTQIFMPNIMN